MSGHLESTSGNREVRALLEGHQPSDDYKVLKLGLPPTEIQPLVLVEDEDLSGFRYST